MEAAPDAFTSHLILANVPSASQISPPSWSGHFSPSCCHYFDAISIDFSRIASPFALRWLQLRNSVLLAVPWNIVDASCRALALSRAMTRTVSVLNVWVFCMHARRLMGCRNVNFAKTSISKPSALGLRFLKGSHPCFPVAPRRPPRPSVNPRPEFRM